VTKILVIHVQRLPEIVQIIKCRKLHWTEYVVRTPETNFVSHLDIGKEKQYRPNSMVTVNIRRIDLMIVSGTFM
jgi:hypothetical protein